MAFVLLILCNITIQLLICNTSSVNADKLLVIAKPTQNFIAFKAKLNFAVLKHVARTQLYLIRSVHMWP